MKNKLESSFIWKQQRKHPESTPQIYKQEICLKWQINNEEEKRGEQFNTFAAERFLHPGELDRLM